MSTRLAALGLGVVASSLLCACFDPDYGPGGFRCGEDRSCPSGYTCVDSPEGAVCSRGETPPPADSRPQPVDAPVPVPPEDGDVPHPPIDAGVPPGPVCTPFERVGGPRSEYELVADADGRPHLFYIGGSSHVSHVWFEAGVWNVEGYQAMGALDPAQHIAAAVDGEDRLHVFFDRTDKAGVVRHIYRLQGQVTWEQAIVHPDATGVSLDAVEDLAVAIEGPNRALFVATRSSTGELATEYVDAVDNGSGFTYKIRCAQPQPLDVTRVMHLRAGASTSHVAVSQWLERATDGLWNVMVFPESGLCSSVKIRTHSEGAIPNWPMPVVVLGDVMHVALVGTGGASGPPQVLKTGAWAFTDPGHSVPAGPIVDQIEAQPGTVAAAKVDGRPVISFLEVGTGPPLVHLVQDKEPQGWQVTATPLWKEPAATISSTRIAARRLPGRVVVHIVAGGVDENTSERAMYHSRCEIPD